jgi:hypothetical protein
MSRMTGLYPLAVLSDCVVYPSPSDSPLDFLPYAASGKPHPVGSASGPRRAWRSWRASSQCCGRFCCGSRSRSLVPSVNCRSVVIPALSALGRGIILDLMTWKQRLIFDCPQRPKASDSATP